jgi:hypothetical protein
VKDILKKNLEDLSWKIHGGFEENNENSQAEEPVSTSRTEAVMPNESVSNQIIPISKKSLLGLMFKRYYSSLFIPCYCVCPFY